MRALVADGEWAPRGGYSPTPIELDSKVAASGSRVWRNTRFDLKEVSDPKITDDQVLIKVKVCGICGSDTHLYETDDDGYIIFSGLTKLPCILGHEFSGVVEEVGSRAIGLEVGDAVTVESVMWCGACLSCRSGAPNQCENINLMGLSSDGAMAPYVAVDARYCWKTSAIFETHSEQEAFDLGSLIEPLGCAYNGMFISGGGFKPGGVVAVFGLGPIGLAAVAFARTAGASKIFAFDVIDDRVQLASDLGADHVYNLATSGEPSASERILELTGGWGSDVSVEAAGAAPYTLPEMEKALSASGNIVYLGRAATEASMALDSLVSAAGKIVGARGHSGYGIFPNIIKLIAAKKLDVGKMITARYPFEQAVDALAKTSDRVDGKILVDLPG